MWDYACPRMRQVANRDPNRVHVRGESVRRLDPMGPDLVFLWGSPIADAFDPAVRENVIVGIELVLERSASDVGDEDGWHSQELTTKYTKNTNGRRGGEYRSWDHPLARVRQLFWIDSLHGIHGRVTAQVLRKGL